MNLSMNGAIVGYRENEYKGNTYYSIMISSNGEVFPLPCVKEVFEQAKKLLLKEGLYNLTISPRVINQVTRFVVSNIATGK